MGVWGGALSRGVRGVSEGDTGVLGTSHGFAGVAAISDSRWFGAYAQAWNGTGLVAAGKRGLYAEGRPAGQFVGDVIVSGNLVVTGWKAAAITHRDGSRRLLHALESPDARFEDFGRARLRDGRAKVQLDPTFASVVRTDDYHVFITAEGESAGLYIARRTRRGFEVREQGRGRSSVDFSYRIVAKRRDVPAGRFARATVAPPLALAVKDLPPKLKKKQNRARALPLAELGPLMAGTWTPTSERSRIRRPAKRRGYRQQK